MSNLRRSIGWQLNTFYNWYKGLNFITSLLIILHRIILFIKHVINHIFIIIFILLEFWFIFSISAMIFVNAIPFN